MSANQQELRCDFEGKVTLIYQEQYFSVTAFQMILRSDPDSSYLYWRLPFSGADQQRLGLDPMPDQACLYQLNPEQTHKQHAFLASSRDFDAILDRPEIFLKLSHYQFRDFVNPHKDLSALVDLLPEHRNQLPTG